MSDKACTQCRELKPLTEYSFKSKATGKLQSYCKDCQRLVNRRYYQADPKKHLASRQATKVAAVARNREHVVNYLRNNPCKDCGEADVNVLEFDHRDRAMKDSDISLLVLRQASIERLQSEIDKCDVRCANCHRRRTRLQLGWFYTNNTPATLEHFGA